MILSDLQRTWMLLPFLLLFGITPSHAQPVLGVNPTSVTLKYIADSLTSLPSAAIMVGVPSGAAPGPFTATFGPAGTADCYVVSPSSGVAPQIVYISLNPNVVPYRRFVGVGCPGGVDFVPTSNPRGAGGVSVMLDLIDSGTPVITSVVNAATLQPGISPGALVTIYGENLSSPPQTGQFNGLGIYPTTLGGTSIAFNGVTAALLYVSTTQINAMVPFEIAGQQTVRIILTRDDHLSLSSSTNSDTTPGIFTTNQNGTGQGAILNNTVVGSSVNSTSNPAPKGSTISIYATGSGVWNPAIASGTVMLGPHHSNKEGDVYMPAAAVSLTIGGKPAAVTYAGPAPYMPAGVIQINAVVPTGIGSAAQPIVLTIGSNSNSQQNVTVAVQ